MAGSSYTITDVEPNYIQYHMLRASDLGQCHVDETGSYLDQDLNNSFESNHIVIRLSIRG